MARASRRFGLGREIARFENRNRAFVSYDGQLLSVPRVQSRKVTIAGEVTNQRELIEVWTWEQLREKRAEAIKASRGYTVKIGHYDRLLALHERAPDAKSPADAAKQLGIDLEDYLGRAEAA